MKDFFKPTKVKLLLTLLIPFYFAVAAQAVVGENAIITSRYSININWMPFALLIFGTMYIWATTERYFYDFSLLSASQKIFSVLLETLLPLAINYILVCLLVYLYKKLKNNKKAGGFHKAANS